MVEDAPSERKPLRLSVIFASLPGFAPYTNETPTILAMSLSEISIRRSVLAIVMLENISIYVDDNVPEA